MDWQLPRLDLSAWGERGLEWHCAGLDEIESVAIDGAALDRADWDVDAEEALLTFKPDARFFDGQLRDIEVSGTLAGRAAKLCARFVSDYETGLDASGPHELSGWIFDRNCPGRTVSLVLERPDGTTVSLRANAPRAGHNGPGGWSGFRFPLAAPRLAEIGRPTATLRIEGTGYHPFGAIDLSPLESGATPIYGARFHRNLGPARALVAILVRETSRRLRRCLTTIAASRDRIASELVIVDVTIGENLRQREALALCAEFGATYLHAGAGERAGAALSRAIGLRPDHDVVIIDPDVAVPAGWLDRLYKACASHSRAGSAAPLIQPRIGGFSNAGDAVLEELSRWADLADQHRAARGNGLDIASASAACFYIRRDALNEIGGLGETDDLDAVVRNFIARGHRQGWRCMLAADVCLDQLLTSPDDGDGTGAAVIRSAVADPRARSRLRRIRIGQWRAAGQIVVLATHALPGGTERHVRDLSRALNDAGYQVIQLQPGESGFELARVAKSGPRQRLSYDDSEMDVEELQADLFALLPEFVHVHHLIDLPRSVGQFLTTSGLPIVVTAHDYFFGCPRVTLLDDGGAYCGAPPAAHCAPCLAAGPPHSALHASQSRIAANGETWRTAWAPLLLAARQIIAPSRSAAELMGKLFPGLEITVRPHGLVAKPAREPLSASEAAAPIRDPSRVAVIGTIGHHKGVEILHELVRYCARNEPDLRFVIIGGADREAALLRYGNVETTGAYRPDEAAGRIEASGCATALFLSIFPETFCFALSEALLAGLTPAAHDFGALGERLRDLGVGALAPLHSSMETLARTIRDAAASEPLQLPRKSESPLLFGDYYAPQLAESWVGSRCMIGAVEGVSFDLWCEARFSISLYCRRPLRSLALMFWYHPAHIAQKLILTIDGQMDEQFWVRPGAVESFSLGVEDRTAHLLRLIGRFDFATPLDKPDRRRAGGKLTKLVVTDIDGVDEAFELSAPRIFANPKPAAALV